VNRIALARALAVQVTSHVVELQLHYFPVFAEWSVFCFGVLDRAAALAAATSPHLGSPAVPALPDGASVSTVPPKESSRPCEPARAPLAFELKVPSCVCYLHATADPPAEFKVSEFSLSSEGTRSAVSKLSSQVRGEAHSAGIAKFGLSFKELTVHVPVTPVQQPLCCRSHVHQPRRFLQGERALHPGELIQSLSCVLHVDATTLMLTEASRPRPRPQTSKYILPTRTPDCYPTFAREEKMAPTLAIVSLRSVV
jgi:hypothetical protein